MNIGFATPAPAPVGPLGGSRLGSSFQPRIHLGTDEADARGRLLALFDSLTFMDSDRRIVCEASIEEDTAGETEHWLWFKTELGPIAGAAHYLDGGLSGWPVSESPVSPPAVLSAMARLEFAIQGLEVIIPAWRPAWLGRGEGRGVRLDLKSEDGHLVHRLVLCIPETTFAGLPVCAPRPVDWARSAVPAPALLIVEGPRVGLQALKTLAIGDLVWLGEAARCSARLRLTAGFEAAGLFDPGQRHFHSLTKLMAAATESDRAGEKPMPLNHSNGGDGESVPRLDDFPVRIHFEFGPWLAQLADLARIAPGSVIPAPEEEGDPEIRVAVEGRIIAHGRLVAIGERYGVLIDRVER